ncbi:isochorismatase family protein [Blastococcus sp. CT_GayMR20]|uniref:cysteine hydrolase family protein n=1 Tax=Blastococcus sp. CT_GayMR20 TaxID=2559609 RepID=UPI001073FA9A|nr:isochorismatase family protein [Blastococcus sp. CT_GayMR20]TFV88954.1 isochorismatase family protein [Blastococcus sp. CT_GayMR20]
MGDSPVPWREALPEAERAIYASAGFGQRQKVSRDVAVLVIDVTYGFTGHRQSTPEESRSAYPNSCGETAWAAVDAIGTLTAAARAAGRPVIYSRDSSVESLTGGVWQHKHGRLDGRLPDDGRIVDDIAPLPGDEVVEKSAPSVFFEGDLAERLKAAGVRDLLIAGTSTSGCVRASVVDGFSHGFGVAVVEECVFDRAATSHRVSLFEIDQKYGDVITLAEALDCLGTVPQSPPAPIKQVTNH